MKRWIITITLLTPICAPFYFLLCGAMGMHYRRVGEELGDTGLGISGRLLADSEMGIFHQQSDLCEVGRYISAESDATSHMGFDAIDMARNWNTDFLKQQPPCR